jgi:adenine-specific DNA methylase
VYEAAKKYLKKRIEEWPWIDQPIPQEQMAPIGMYGIDAQRYTEKQQFGELYNARQKLALITFLGNCSKYGVN